MTEIEFSLRGKDRVGRYHGEGKISVYLNTIAKYYDPDDSFDEFVSEIASTIFHEIGHYFEDVDGMPCSCKSKICNSYKCWWCTVTGKLHYWLLWNKGIKGKTDSLHLVKEYPSLFILGKAGKT